MLHAVKRKVARAQQPLRSAPNAEYADLRQRLSSVKANLRYISGKISSANRLWVVQMQDQRHFSERFQEAYPSTTEPLYQVAVQFAQGSQALYDRFTRETEKDVTAYNDIHKQVLLYIKEIEAVEAMYSKLNDAKSEAGRYQAKLDNMERSKKQMDEAKKMRNLQKMDNERDQYRKLLTETVAAQKATYVKHPIVFKAALTSYWLSHEKHVTLLVQSLEKTQQFAKMSEKEMRELDITKWTPPVDMLVGPFAEKIISDIHSVEGRTEVERVQEPEEFHSASTVPVENAMGEDAAPEPVESPTNVVAVASMEPLVRRKESTKEAAHEERLELKPVACAVTRQ